MQVTVVASSDTLTKKLKHNMLRVFAQPLFYVVSNATQYGEMKIFILFWKIFYIALS